MNSTIQEQIQLISGKFGQVLPDSREKSLVVILLHLQIKQEIIEEEFSEAEFNDAMDEVGEMMGRDKSIRKETPIRELRAYFLIYNRKARKYRLSQYAEEFARMVLNQVHQSRNVKSLKLTFRSTFQLTEVDVESIEALEHWFHDRFLATAKRDIDSVIDALQEEINREYDEMSAILDQELENLHDLLAGFQERFTRIREKSEDIRETIEARQEVINYLQQAEDRFLADSEAWEKFKAIDDKINSFFARIDFRLQGLYDIIDQAVKKLGRLYENFRFKRQHKLRLEQFLVYLLRESKKEEKGKISLPGILAEKAIPHWKIRFQTLPVEFEMRPEKAVMIKPEVDATELEKERDKQIRMLEKQKISDFWTQKLENLILESAEKVEVTDYLYQISQEADYEIAINVAGNILWKFGNRQGFELEIQQSELNQKEPDNLLLWKMSISPLAF